MQPMETLAHCLAALVGREEEGDRGKGLEAAVIVSGGSEVEREKDKIRTRSFGRELSHTLPLDRADIGELVSGQWTVDPNCRQRASLIVVWPEHWH